MRLNGKKVIVTGAGNGIGKELVLTLLSKGAIVAGLDVNKAALDALEDEVKSDRLKTYVVDVSKKSNIEGFYEKFKTDFEHADVLINNAGIIQPFKNVTDLDDETIEKVMNINFYGPMNLTRIFLKDLLKRPEAYVVNVSSMGGFFPFPSQTVYGASKAALKIFTEGLYAELLNTHVKVMVVFPGGCATNITKNSKVRVKKSAGNSGYKMTPPWVAAEKIVKGIEKDKFKVFIGQDANFMRMFYKFNSKLAIKTINNAMNK